MASKRDKKVTSVMSNKAQKVLVIDDSTTNVVLLEAILQSKGYGIQTALSAEEGMAIIRKDRPALILLDLLMPEVSGYDFLEAIHKDPKISDIPVIAVSAVTDRENKERTMKLGAVDFIEKPVEINKLVAKVEEYLV